jgi:exodeoxyribonuclease-3
MRAALRKGYAQHIEELQPDVVLLQEIRALPEQLPAAWRDPEGWHVVWHPAVKKGYAGTAILSRHPIEVLGRGIGADDDEGRVVTVRTGGVRVVSVYLPSGSSGEVRQAVKDTWLVAFASWLDELLALDEPVVVGGDFNIAHTEHDIWNPKGNAKNSGFLPHERAWFTDILSRGWRDTTRDVLGEGQGPYSWWSNRGQARAKDRGWRIDYLLANPSAASDITGAGIHKEGGMTVSDHAPVWLDLG